jgi:hypothetical protein
MAKEFHRVMSALTIGGHLYIAGSLVYTKGWGCIRASTLPSQPAT